MQYGVIWPVIFIFMPIFLVGCGTTSAPTESSTNTSDNTTNSTLDVTSSTTPGSADSTARAEAFTHQNYAQIQADMAVGGGEYVAALAYLLQIPPDLEQQFFHLSREKYTTLYGTPNTTPQRMLTRLRREMAADPQLRR